MAVLLDTGVLLRAFVKSDPQYKPIRETLRQLIRNGEELVTSFQNIAEFINVSTRPTAARGGYGLAHSTVVTRVDFIELLCRLITENDASYLLWKALVADHGVTGVAVHDARLVAVMLSHSVHRVLTLNAQDFRRYESEGIVVLSPYEV